MPITKEYKEEQKRKNQRARNLLDNIKTADPFSNRNILADGLAGQQAQVTANKEAEEKLRGGDDEFYERGSRRLPDSEAFDDAGHSDGDFQ